MPTTLPVERPAPGSAAYYKLAIILGSLSAMGPLAIDMYLPSFPTIAQELHSTPSAVQVTAAVYFIGLGIGQAIYGPLSDRIGRTRPLYFGLLVFMTASIVCARATSVPMLIAARLAQALGGCAEMVVSRAMVRDFFDERESVRVLSLLMLVMGLAPILAPLIGGQLLHYFGWRAIFWALAFYAAAALTSVMFLLRESLPEERRKRQSVKEVAAVYGSLLRDREYVGYVLVGSLILSGMFAYIAGSPFVFIELFHVPAERFGFYFGANAAGLIAASQINGRLAHRMHARDVLRIVLAITAIASLVLLVNASTGFGGFVGILIPLFVCVSSVGFVMPNTTALAMEPYGNMAGSASALLGTVRFVLGAGAGALVSALNDGSARPLGLVVAICGTGAFLIFKVSALRRPLPQ